MGKADRVKELEKQWQHFSALLPNGGTKCGTLHVVECDPIPPADSRGWRRAEGWKAVWEGPILPEWANWGDTLHGGMAAWLIDNCTSVALVGLHTPTFWGPPMTAGVSINLEVSLLKPVPVGGRVRITAEVLRLSETLANLKCEIADAETGRVLVVGNHIKAWRSSRQSRL